MYNTPIQGRVAQLQPQTRSTTVTRSCGDVKRNSGWG